MEWLDKTGFRCTYNHMYHMSAIQRAAAFLVIIFLLGGVCWLDTLDLTDDIQLTQPFAFGQQGVEPEDAREYLLGQTALMVWFVAPLAPAPQPHGCLAVELDSAACHRPLYQSLCTYRI